jgi:hypothetical protein
MKYGFIKKSLSFFQHLCQSVGKPTTAKGCGKGVSQIVALLFGRGR